MEADRLVDFWLSITVITVNKKRPKVSTGILRTASWFVSAYSVASVEFQFDHCLFTGSPFDWVYTYTA